MKIGDPGTSDLGQKGFAALPEAVGPTGGIWIGMLHSDGNKHDLLAWSCMMVAIT